MRTKYSILEERLAKAELEAARLRNEIRGLDGTPCGLTCGGCGELLETEGDFARHFFIKKFDEFNNHLNLGSCPNVDRS
jgi:hypothetical protein